MARNRKCHGDRPWSGDMGQSCPSVSSYLDFYTHIPDYSDLHDLSDAEFYERLNTLKTTHKLLTNDDRDSALGVERPSSQSSLSSKLVDGHMRGDMPHIVVQSPLTPMGDSPLCQSPPFHHHHDAHKDLCKSMGALSLDSSGLRVHGQQCGLGLRPHSRAANRPTKLEEKHAVPLLSRIPLFHTIMAEQEERRKVIHELNSRELQSLVKPFSFTKREEEEKLMRADCMSSLPCEKTHECARGRRSRSRTPFRARPVPRDLFSDRVYDRMREDQFYRALRNKIRAEEMLKNARMPPSMEAREKITPKKATTSEHCGRQRGERSRSGSYAHSKNTTVWREPHNSAAWREAPVNQSRQARQWQDNPYNRPSSHAWHNPPANHMRNTSHWRGSSIGQSNSSSAEASPNESTLGMRRRKPTRPTVKRTLRPSSNLSVSRSNLASVLRMQTARSRIQKQIQRQIEEQHNKEQVRFKARLIRLSPAWRALDYSTDEDLALRLAQRRHEARTLNKRHRMLMGCIQGRVHHMPPLFQQPERKSVGSHERKSKSLDSSLDTLGSPQNAQQRPSKSQSFCPLDGHKTKNVCSSSMSSQMDSFSMLNIFRYASRLNTKMGPIETSIRNKLTTELKPFFLDVLNESYMHNVPKEAEMHFKVIAVAEEFQGMPLIQRHRRIQTILDEELKNGLHALSIVAKTPEQWEQSNHVEKSPKCLGGAGK